MSSAWQPTKVCVLDVETCPPAISAAPGYGALRALVRVNGRPLGIVKLPFERAELRRDELMEAVATLPAPLRTSSPDDGSRFELPMASVVIATMFERRDLLAQCLRSLRQLDYPHYEVIVVDNRRVVTEKIELEGVRFVHEPRPGLSAARNRGLALANGEIVAFTDDDVEVDAGWLRALATRLQRHPDEAAVTGLVFPREIETPAQQMFEDYYDGFGPQIFEPMSHRLRQLPGVVSTLRPATVDALADDGRCLRSFSLYLAGNFGVGANMAFRTDVLRELGGFDLALGPGTIARNGEELAVFARLAWRGHALAFEPAAVVQHAHRREEDALVRQVFSYGLGVAAMLTSLVLEDPRHLGRMLASLPRAVNAVLRGYRRKRSTRQPADQTRALALREVHGMLSGPFAYLRSRRQEAL